jgi:hypothetical protein
MIGSLFEEFTVGQRADEHGPGVIQVYWRDRFDLINDRITIIITREHLCQWLGCHGSPPVSSTGTYCR